MIIYIVCADIIFRYFPTNGTLTCCICGYQRITQNSNCNVTFALVNMHNQTPHQTCRIINSGSRGGSSNPVSTNVMHNDVWEPTTLDITLTVFFGIQRISSWSFIFLDSRPANTTSSQHAMKLQSKMGLPSGVSELVTSWLLSEKTLMKDYLQW